MAGTEQDAAAPLVIGVTGHRNIEMADPRLRQIVLDELAWLRAGFPGRPLVILSPLAEGADRLVARLAMERFEAKLVVPLPMPREEYEKDFAAEESKAEFRELLLGAKRWTELPVEASSTEASIEGEARRRLYARAGAYIVEHCAVLIAVWDGLEARGTGGTGDMVKWKTEGGVPAEFSSLAAASGAATREDAGFVIHIDPHTYEVTHLPVQRQAQKWVLE